jgi:hypothetical protein
MRQARLFSAPSTSHSTLCSPWAAPRLHALVFALAFGLSACGGGGGSSAPAPAPAPATAPQVSQAPVSRAVAAGATVAFSVAAVGTGPFTYQWRRDGQAIGGATSATYTTPVLGTGDDGARYSVVVTNSAGSATSSDAVVSVFAAPAAATSCASAPVADLIADSGTNAVGRAVSVVLAGCNGALSNVQWTAAGVGAGLTLLSDKTQAITFEPAAAGTYSFSVTFRDAGNNAVTRNVDVPVTGAAPATRISIRGSGAVREGARTSLRAWPTLATGDTIARVRWSQVEGPAVEMDTSDPNRAIFTVPAVTRDTVLRFRVTLTTTGGQTASDDALVVVEKYAQAPNSNAYPFNGLHVSRVYPYKPTSPFAASLVNCTYNAQLQYLSASSNNLCTLNTLPFLHQTTGGAVPTTAQIMDRVIVSHDWMGKNFEDFISSANASDDLKRMFNGVTAIVIGAQVRPSFYYALTGAIYLDANNFWLSPEQRDVISEVPDFRSGFDRDLRYSGLWRYAFNNQSIFVAFPAGSRISRDLSYLLNEAGWLMYHELGHASDFLPPAARTALNNGVSAWDNIAPRFSARQLPSDLLSTQLPLTSGEMRALAQVKFQTGPTPGQTVNGIPYETLTTYTPQQAAGFFSADRATDEYAYSTTREDIAMVIEEFLMQRNHQFRRDVAITDKITPSTTSSTLIVRWGQRGRVGETSVKPRAQFVVEQLTPWVLQQNANAVASIPAPIPMRAGDSWAANVALPAPPGQVGGLSNRGRALTAEEDRMLLDRAQTGAHGGAGGSEGDRPFGHWTPNDRWLQQLRQQ